MKHAAVLIASALVLAACGDPDAPGDDATGTSATTESVPGTEAPITTDGTDTVPPDVDLGEPPPITFETDDGPLAVAAVTYCWNGPPDEDGISAGVCADGLIPDPPPDAGVVDDELRFSFPVDGWSFSASLHTDGTFTDQVDVAVTEIDEQRWAIDLASLAGDRVLTVFGRGPQGDVFAGVRVATPREVDQSSSQCPTAITSLRRALPAYDYQPADDLLSLVDRVDAVVVGTVDAIGPADDATIEFVLVDTITWGGSIPVERVEIDGSWPDDPAAIIEDLDGARVIAFVHELDGGDFGADVQGLHIACGDDTIRVIEPLPDDADDSSIDEIRQVVAQRKAPVDDRTDRDGVLLEPPAEISVGDTAPVQLWWSCAVGRNVRVGDDRYLPADDVENAATEPAGAWDDGDFPVDWEVIIYNETPVDGDDWVMLDAIAERIDDATLEVRHVGTDRVVGTFVRDDTPPDERTMCG